MMRLDLKIMIIAAVVVIVGALGYQMLINSEDIATENDAGPGQAIEQQTD